MSKQGKYTITGKQLRERIEYAQLYLAWPTFEAISLRCGKGKNFIGNMCKARVVHPMKLRTICDGMKVGPSLFVGPLDEDGSPILPE